MRPLLLCCLLALAPPALAAEPTARVTGGDINIRSGPGARYDVIGKLPNGSEVELDYCTTNDRWCLVAGAGWVDASYLVGWSAKIRATPPDFMTPRFEPNDDFWPGW